jgi:dihydroflavonol-4-reductase
MPRTKLVIGASGFLGSHVTRELVERGHQVRVMLRTTSPTRGIDDLEVERVYGDLFDTEALRRAMAGCDVVFHCAVDTRAWIRDPKPLFRTNVDGLRNVLDVAAEVDLERFVFTSSIGTVGRGRSGPATEETQQDELHRAGAYIRSRVEAENLVLDRAREQGLPAVVMCVANTYGPGDWVPTPHGALLSAAARGRLPTYFRKTGSEVVGVRDAEVALVLAAEKGRVGERYIVSERFMTNQEMNSVAAGAGGSPAPRFGVPLPLLALAGRVGDVAARLRRTDYQLTSTSVRLMATASPVDHSKAMRELGWTPTPAPEVIREAARFFVENRRSRAQE